MVVGGRGSSEEDGFKGFFLYMGLVATNLAYVSGPIL